jgi:hypothetical protein
VLRADSTERAWERSLSHRGLRRVRSTSLRARHRLDLLQSDDAGNCCVSKYQNPTNFLCSTSPCGGVFVNQPSRLTAYMLVNNASDLQLVSTAPSATYALGRDIDAGSITNFVPIRT